MKNISFDVWGTLIKSNPTFKQEQSKLAKEMFGITEEVFIENCKNIKQKFNIYVELYGYHFDRLDLYDDIFTNEVTTLLYDYNRDLDNFIKESDKLFLKHPPINLYNDTLIQRVISNNNCFITSNTVLIYGDVLGQVINNYFDIPINKMVFSDEYWMSKPNLGIFKTHNVSLDYHIGDNDITDGACEKLNIKYINIKNNYESLQTLM